MSSMSIDQLITALTELKAQHGGEAAVTVWAYAGGNDALCDVQPVFDQELGVVVLETSFCKPEISR